MKAGNRSIGARDQRNQAILRVVAPHLYNEARSHSVNKLTTSLTEQMRRRHTLKKFIFVLALTAFASVSLACSQDQSNPEAKSTDPPSQTAAEEAGGPESVLRQFLSSMSAGDSDSIKVLALPNDDIAMLWTGDKPSAVVIETMQKFYRTAEIKRLKVGDQFKLPNGKTMVFDASHINDKRQQLSLPGWPLPFILVKTEKLWQVDASPVITARKIAKAAKEKQATNKSSNK